LSERVAEKSANYQFLEVEGIRDRFIFRFQIWAGGTERDPGGAERPTAESAWLQRRKDLSTSGLLGDRTREMLHSVQHDSRSKRGTDLIFQ
jgi:hypothetical protein